MGLVTTHTHTHTHLSQPSVTTSKRQRASGFPIFCFSSFVPLFPFPSPHYRVCLFRWAIFRSIYSIRRDKKRLGYSSVQLNKVRIMVCLATNHSFINRCGRRQHSPSVCLLDSRDLKASVEPPLKSRGRTRPHVRPEASKRYNPPCSSLPCLLED